MNDVSLLAEGIVNKAKKRGCDSAEVFIKTARMLSVEAQDKKVDALETARDFGMSLRVIRNGKLGFSFTTRRDTKEEIENIVEEAIKGSDWTASDKYVDIPEFSEPAEVLVIDKNIKNLGEEEVISNSLDLEKATLESDTRIKKVRKAEVSLAVSETSVVNSRGVGFSYESGYLAAHVTALASDGKDSQTGWDFAISRRLSDIDFKSISQGASKRALELLGARRISTAKAPVILDPSVAVDFLGIFSASLSAEAVQKKRSFLAGKSGEMIMSTIVTIVDNGIMPWGIGSRPIDDEGVPTRNKTLVSGGVLTGFIHNTYTAKKEGVASTGNASRRSFKDLPRISVTNLYIEPGETGKTNSDALIRSVSRGMLVREAMGVHTADPISGDFSVGISGHWVENGEVKYPVKEAVLTGNILELFRRIETVGPDLRFYGNIGSPSLLIEEMDISA
jgi:PmbA protein